MQALFAVAILSVVSTAFAGTFLHGAPALLPAAPIAPVVAGYAVPHAIPAYDGSGLIARKEGLLLRGYPAGRAFSYGTKINHGSIAYAPAVLAARPAHLYGVPAAAVYGAPLGFTPKTYNAAPYLPYAAPLAKKLIL